MKIEKDWTIPADPTRAFAALTDPELLSHLAESMLALDHTVSVEPDDDGAIVTVDRDMPTDSIPSTFRGMLGDRVKVIETQRWSAPSADGSRRADLDLDLVGLPLRYTGTITLDGSAGTQTRMSITGNLKASVPLIGGNVEKATAPVLSAAMDVEARESAKWVQSH